MGADVVERTFCFVDLAGFTALTEAHGDAEAVSLLDEFLALARASLGPDDELVKSIGDAVMLASPAPEAALHSVTALMQGCQERSRFLLPQAGAHHGPAIARHGDYLGAAVNLAARVTGHAGGGQLPEREAEWVEFLAECDKAVAELAHEVAVAKFTLAELDEEEQNHERLRRWFRDVRAKDLFGAPSAERAERRLKECAEALEDYAERVYQARQQP
jgi:hypothetical protein